jgi:FkbM family methyltransferase
MISLPVRILDRTYDIFGYPDDPQYLDFARPRHPSFPYGEWREFNLSHLRHLVQPGMRCIDVGAYAGVMSLAMAQLGGSVWAYEGSQRQCEALHATFDRAKCCAAWNNVVGAGDYVEWIPDGTSSHAIPTEEGSIQTYALDHLERCDLLKIDAEGAELGILNGADRLLEKHRPIVLIEFNAYAFLHYHNLLPAQALDAMLRRFPHHYYFHRRNGELRPLTDRRKFLAYNYLHGMVDDLLLSYVPVTLPVPPPYPPDPPPPDPRHPLRRALSAAAASVGL